MICYVKGRLSLRTIVKSQLKAASFMMTQL
nr:MAG TPA: hypothetical protein [Caudoviricetes sp.]